MEWPASEKPKNKGGKPKGGRGQGKVIERPKQGSNHKATVDDIRRRAALSGDLPHEFLLKVARGDMFYHGGVKIRPTIEMRIDCAKAAAPYFAPKLAQLDLIKNLTDDDLNAIIENAATEAGLSSSFSGEGSKTIIIAGSGQAHTTH